MHQPNPVDLPPQPVVLSWHEFFVVLQKHSKKFHSLDVEPNSNPPLEEWIAEQRALYQEDKKGIKTTLTLERKLLMDALGFEWEPQQQSASDVGAEGEMEANPNKVTPGENDGVTDATDQADEEATGGLVAVQQDPSQLNTPQEKQEMEMQEGHAHAHEQPPHLLHDPNSAAAALEAEMQDVATFNARLGQLQQFKEVHGHPNVPHEYKEDEDLEKWCTEQRDLYTKGMLTQDRVDALVSIGFDLQADRKYPFFSFDERIQQLFEYKEIHGHIRIPRKCDPQLQG
jgi:hypothetical protein